jgi:predicted esterase
MITGDPRSSTMTRVIVLFPLLLAGLQAQDPEASPPYPTGSTSQQIAGLRVQLVVPQERPEPHGYSLIVILHGAGGTETGMASSLQALASQGYIICAPKSVGQTWSDSDLARVKEITRTLLDAFTIEDGRLHGVGFSNGGWNLGPLVFDDELPFVSACWIAAGFTGGSVPRRARQTMGALALAGANDPNRAAAEGTVKALREKVRTVECRIQEGLGHEWTDQLMPYYHYWVGAMEGRYVPGETLVLDWAEDLPAARQQMEEQRRAGLLYFYAASDADEKEGKPLQTVTLHDPLVLHFARQLVAVKLDRAEHEELYAGFKLKRTPALVITRPNLKKLKSFSGRIRTKMLVKVLRAVSPDRELPD